MQDEMIYFSGVNGETGQYFREPLDAEAIRKLARGHEVEPDDLRRPIEGIDEADLASAGWAVLIPEGFDSECEKALEGLLKLRQGQAGSRFQKIVVDIDEGRSAGDKVRLLEKHGTSAGPVNPKKLPYYLLIAGSPEQIPYRLQFQLGVQHAVGRICFGNPEQYRNYARNAVQAEEGKVRRDRRLGVGQAMSYFGERYADLAADIFDERLEKEFAGEDPNEVNPYLWTAIRDARSYITLGDPAVRIPLK